MKTRNFLAALLLMVAGLQTTWAQKIILHMPNNQKVEYEISQLDSITFVEGEEIIDDTHGILNGHAWVDLGLPSCTLWATCNIGANVPEEFGNYFSWGETMPKDVYNWSTYKYCEGSRTTMTKYCNNSYYGSVDDKTQLELSDDAACINWGGTWRMPTLTEMNELINNCIWTWISQNNVNGYKITGSNGNSIFLPAVGYCGDAAPGGYVNGGYYWSSSLKTANPWSAGILYFYDTFYRTDTYYRYHGLTIRPVTKIRNQ